MESLQEKRSVSRRKIVRKPENVVEFEKWEAKQKGDWNYEFYYGDIIKKGGMKQNEVFLIEFLIDCFLVTEAKKNRSSLMPEVNVYIDDQRKRVPDIAYFTRTQIISMRNGLKEVPAFVIEIVSKNESLYETEIKKQDYFAAGMQIVWHVLPISKSIYAYTPNKLVQVFADGDVATASPILPDFKVDIDKLFTVA